jgi:hypothetical protein
MEQVALSHQVSSSYHDPDHAKIKQIADPNFPIRLQPLGRFMV